MSSKTPLHSKSPKISLQTPNQTNHMQFITTDHCSLLQAPAVMLPREHLIQIQQVQIQPRPTQFCTTVPPPQHQTSPKNERDDQVNPGVNLDDEDDDEYNNFNLDYELVLTKILNEKKLALSNLPDVIKFLSTLQQQHQQRSQPQQHNNDHHDTIIRD